MQEIQVEYEGRDWMLGKNSGKWYVYDGQQWVKSDPPTASPASGASSPATPMVDASDAAVKRSDATPQATTPSQERASPSQERASAPPDAPPAVSVTEGAHSPAVTPAAIPPPRVHDRQITVGQFEALARALQAMREQKRLSEQDFKSLFAVLRCQGPDNTIWAVGLPSLRWHQFDQGGWVQATPPVQLSIAADVLITMQQRVPGTSLAALLSEPAERSGPGLDHPLQQPDTLQQGEESPRALPPPMAPPEGPVPDPKSSEDYVQRGMFYEQQGHYEPAISVYQRALEADAENLEAAQRLAFLLQKRNRDMEAAALWDKILGHARDTNERLRRPCCGGRAIPHDGRGREYGLGDGHAGLGADQAWGDSGGRQAAAGGLRG